MGKTYNQNQTLQARNPTFNPLFWEVCVDQEVLNHIATEASLYHESSEEGQSRLQREEWVRAVMPTIHRVMRQVLTPRQHQIVQLYFLEQRTEQEIAQYLGISAVTVSQHLFGKRRNGLLVGGAIPKLRKKLTAAGILKQAG